MWKQYICTNHSMIYSQALSYSYRWNIGLKSSFSLAECFFWMGSDFNLMRICGQNSRLGWWDGGLPYEIHLFLRGTAQPPTNRAPPFPLNKYSHLQWMQRSVRPKHQRSYWSWWLAVSTKLAAECVYLAASADTGLTWCPRSWQWSLRCLRRGCCPSAPCRWWGTDAPWECGCSFPSPRPRP